jgi:uncharacterized protein YdgA (DUF945 family)
MFMGKSVKIVGGIAVLAVVGWAGGSWYTGKMVEERAVRHLAKINAQMEKIHPMFGVHIEQLSYERGWLSSHARYGISLVSDNVLLKDFPVKSIEIDSRIEHGPFPLGALQRGTYAPQLAYLHTELAKSKELEPLFALFKDAPPFVSDDIASYDGKIDSVAQISPVQFENPQFAVNFTGMKITGAADLKAESYSFDALTDTLSFKDRKHNSMEALMSGIGLKGQGKKGKFELGIGDSSLLIKKIDITGGNEPSNKITISVADLGYTAQLSETDSALSVNAGYQVGGLSVNGTPWGSGQFMVNLKDMDGESVKQLTAVYREAMGSAFSAKQPGPEVFEKLVPAALASIRKLLEGKPSLSVQPLMWKSPKGESQFTGTVNFGLPESFDSLDLAKSSDRDVQLALVQAIKNIDAKLVISKPMWEELSTQLIIVKEGAKPERAARQAQQFIAMMSGMAEMTNYGVNKGDNLESAFSYANGKATLNGKEIPASSIFSVLAAEEEDLDDEDEDEE